MLDLALTDYHTMLFIYTSQPSVCHTMTHCLCRFLSLTLRCGLVGWQASDVNAGNPSLHWEKPDYRQSHGTVLKLRTLYPNHLSQIQTLLLDRHYFLTCLIEASQNLFDRLFAVWSLHVLAQEET